MVSGRTARTFLFLFLSTLVVVGHVSAAGAGKKRGKSVVFELKNGPGPIDETTTGSKDAPSFASRDLTAADIDAMDAILTDDASANSATRPVSRTALASRIAYGSAAPEDILNFAVYLEIKAKDGVYSCGASLVADRWLVSAAHCLVDEFGRTSAQSVTAIIGEKDIRRVPNRAMYNVKTFIVPTTFAPARNGNLQGDIAVLKLDRAVPSEFKPIQLASKDTSIPPWLVVAGWGVTETNRSPSSKLKYVAVPSLTVSQVKKFGQMTGTYFQMEDDKMAAGLGEGDSCSGDSGGPLIIPSKDEFTNSDADKSVLVGVVSYGLSARCQSGKNTVGFYTAIEPYANWIKSEIGGRRRTKKKKRSRKEA